MTRRGAYFNSMHLNMYVTSVIPRAQLPHVVIEKVDSTPKAPLEKLHAEINEAIGGAEVLCKAHGITCLANYDTEPHLRSRRR